MAAQLAWTNFSESKFFPGGQWSAGGWLEYWQAVWSAPTQPGYVKLVRDGVRALRDLALALHAQASTVADAVLFGDTSSESIKAELFGIASELNLVWIPLTAGVDDANVLRLSVVEPLLSRGDAPLIELGTLMGVVQQMKPLRTFGEIFGEEIAQPIAETAMSVGRVARGSVGLLPLVGLAVAGFFLAKWLGIIGGGGTEGGAE